MEDLLLLLVLPLAVVVIGLVAEYWVIQPLRRKKKAGSADEILSPRGGELDLAKDRTDTPTPPRVLLTAADYGPLLYEEHFRTNDQTWHLPRPDAISQSQLVLEQGTSAYPHSDTQYSDFIFQTRFRHLEPTHNCQISVYLRQQVPPCPQWNCSVEIWASGDWNTVGSRRIRGDEAMRLLVDTPAGYLNRATWNTLAVVLQGSKYEIYVDDDLVGRFTDSTYRSGKFILSSPAGAAAFDYVRIYGLP